MLSSGTKIGQKLDNPQTTQMINPIASLCENQEEWVIKARVESKSKINEWRNPFSAGQWFSIHLCDDSGRIRAVAFKENCERFYDTFEIDKVYYLSGCRVQLADPKYTDDHLELVIYENTVVAECMEDALPGATVKYNFVPIDQVVNNATGSLIDVIGICDEVADPEDVDNAGCEKRELTLVDCTGYAVILTLWNTEALGFKECLSRTPVIAVKGARVKEFNGGKYLSCLASSMVRLEPDLPEANMLRYWYDSYDAETEFVNISAV